MVVSHLPVIDRQYADGEWCMWIARIADQENDVIGALSVEILLCLHVLALEVFAHQEIIDDRNVKQVLSLRPVRRSVVETQAALVAILLH